MCSMGGVATAGWKFMGVLMVAMLPGFVEAAGLVRDACKTFGDDTFDKGCGFGCGANSWNGADYGACSTTEWTPAECNTRCTSPSACSPRTSRLPDCCVARALHHLVLHTLVRVLISLSACSHFALLSLLLFTSIDFQQDTAMSVRPPSRVPPSLHFVLIHSTVFLL